MRDRRAPYSLHTTHARAHSHRCSLACAHGLFGFGGTTLLAGFMACQWARTRETRARLNTRAFAAFVFAHAFTASARRDCIRNVRNASHTNYRHSHGALAFVMHTRVAQCNVHLMLHECIYMLYMYSTRFCVLGIKVIFLIRFEWIWKSVFGRFVWSYIGLRNAYLPQALNIWKTDEWAWSCMG